MKFATLLSFILVAWIMGIVSEYMGSSIALWSFCPTSEGFSIARTIACWSPSPYLTFGCWPLEFITQTGLTSFISQISIINVNVPEKAEDTEAKMRNEDDPKKILYLIGQPIVILLSYDFPLLDDLCHTSENMKPKKLSKTFGLIWGRDDNYLMMFPKCYSTRLPPESPYTQRPLSR